jgi:hypothetical protein
MNVKLGKQKSVGFRPFLTLFASASADLCRPAETAFRLCF